MSDPRQTPYGPTPPRAHDIHHDIGRRSSVLMSQTSLLWVNAVYYPNYRCHRGETPASLNYRCISHVFYAFATVEPDGGVLLSDEAADLTMAVDGMQGCIGSLQELKRQHRHLKVLLSIGGSQFSASFASVAADPVKRDYFARSVRELVDGTGFDGVDIDWEHPSDPQQGADFVTLLAAVRTYLPSNDIYEYLVTAALPAGQWLLRNIDLPTAAIYLDYLNLMGYDYSGPASPVAWHHAQLKACGPNEPALASAVEYVRGTGFPAKKILLGVPVYGRSFLGAFSAGAHHTGHGGEDGVYEYKELPRPGATEEVDSSRVAAYCINDGGEFVSYDNPETIKMKSLYCRAENLGGLFYWTGTADVLKGSRSLVETGFRTLHRT